MIIPPTSDRVDFYVDVINKCEASQPDRRQACNQWRQYYLAGTLGNQQNVYQNRIRDKIDLLSSFLYAQEQTKFDVKFSAHVPPEQKAYTDTMREVVLDLWHNTDTDRRFGNAVTWALCFGSMFKKVVPTRRGIETFPLEPSCLGVFREDIDSFDQEAISMSYWVTKSELSRQLFNHPNRDVIMTRVEAAGHAKDESSTIPETVNRIIISQVSPNMVGTANADGQGLRQDFLPRVDEPLIECRELWVWDDSLRDGAGDYRVWSAALPDITFWDRPNIFIPGEHPFVRVCAFPLYNYFWGFSLVAALIGLNAWRDKRIGQIDKLLEKNLKPPMRGIGTGPLGDEKKLALWSPGGFVPVPQANAKFEVEQVQVDQNAWNLINSIDDQMDEVVRISKTLKGRGDEGVRSEGHAQFLGRMGLAPIKKPALLIEDAVEDEATLMLKAEARESKQKYLADKVKGERKTFLLSQVSPDYRVRVAAHSSSPVFAEENKMVAEGLFKAGAISKQTLIEMLDPPMIETILARLPQLEEGQMKAAELQAMQEQSKTEKNIAQAQAAKAKVGLVSRVQ